MNDLLPPPDITVIKDEIGMTIMEGWSLGREQLLVILALLDGGYGNREIIQIRHELVDPFGLPEHIVEYEPIFRKGRPKVNKKEGRDIKIAQIYQSLRDDEHLGFGQAYELLSEYSKEHFGEFLSVDNIQACVKKGRKYILERKNFREKMDNNTIRSYVEKIGKESELPRLQGGASMTLKAQPILQID